MTRYRYSMHIDAGQKPLRPSQEVINGRADESSTLRHEGERRDRRLPQDANVPDTLGAKLAHRFRDERHPDPGRDKADHRGQLRCFLNNLWTEASTLAGRDDCVVEHAAVGARIEDEGLRAQLR